MRKPFRQLGPAWGKCAQRHVLADDAGDFVVTELPVGVY